MDLHDLEFVMKAAVGPLRSGKVIACKKPTTSFVCGIGGVKQLMCKELDFFIATGRDPAKLCSIARSPLNFPFLVNGSAAFLIEKKKTPLHHMHVSSASDHAQLTLHWDYDAEVNLQRAKGLAAPSAGALQNKSHSLNENFTSMSIVSNIH